MAAQHSSEPPPISPDTEIWRLMTRAVARISPEARLNEAARKLAAVGAGALAVGTTESLVGIVSERDLTRAYGRAEDPSALLVSDVASTDLIWCEPSSSATDAAAIMCERGVRHLLVGDGGTADLQGIVSARDLIEALIGPGDVSRQ